MVLRADSAATERAPLLEQVQNSNGGTFDNDSISTSSPTGTIVPHGIEPAKSIAEEEASLGDGETGAEESGIGRSRVVKIIGVLLIGIFVGHADSSILLATHGIIASEFNSLENSTWLITSFALAGAATQTMYGKLSDIYGRKPLVISAYIIFIIGCFIVGIGQTMGQVILGRVISGAGSAGMGALVSVLITDLLPIREVAQWRAYINLVATLGRSVGGPLGGWLADAIGWRWSFLGQVPIVGLSIVLCTIYLPGHAESLKEPENLTITRKSKFSRIDFKGSFIFAIMVLSLLLPIELGGSQFPWTHPIILSLFVLSALLLVLFIRVEKRAPEPILPLEIFHRRDAVLSFVILGLQTAAQLGLMFSVPIYFQITSKTSTSAAGAHLIPAVFGNAVGGLASGLLIKRLGRYKSLVLIAVITSSLSYLLLMLRWHGNTNWLESLYILPSGLGTGIAQSALFISLQVVIDPAHMAPAISFMYLSTTVFITIGLPLSNAIMHAPLRWGLQSRLLALGLSGAEIQKIVVRAISDLEYVGSTTGAVHKAIVASYVDGLWWSHGFSFFCSATALVLALLLKEKRLDTVRV
ncbi:major facilitator superfamily domain-containing protein [Podospora appendiculata]|uniref:Major facilitator superfamily domain-containing protein n=1 Tax=Podospora appendiculata TaxID=314037 RepID=A0AAE0XBN5_9PEZI|nr:major facilitator superfamily domain-containing protein [Podospora appendiculata]